MQNNQPEQTAMRNIPIHWILLFVFLLAIAVFIPFLGGGRTLTSHEVMVTHPAQRIIEDGRWIVPSYASGVWLDKPPLANWLTALSFRIAGGFSEFAARLPAALAAIGLCLVVTLLAMRTENRRAVLFAGIAQATMVYMYMQGRLGEPDMLFALFLTAAQGTLYWHWCKGRFDMPIKLGVLFYLLAALAVLTKGLLAVIFIGLTVCAFAFVRRTWKPITSLLFSPGIILFIFIAGGWHLAAYLAVGQQAIDEWTYNSVLRFFGFHHLDNSRSWLFYLYKFPFYFYTVPWLTLPWSILLIAGARRLWQDTRRTDGYGDQFLWCWFVTGLIFLTLCFFKHKHYIIPALPPLSILAGRLADLHIVWRGKEASRFYAILVTCLVITFMIVGGAVMPRRDHRRPTVEFLHNDTALVPEGEPLYVIGLGQSSAYPYINHAPLVYLDDPAAVRQAIKKNGQPIWALAFHGYVPQAEEEGFVFEEIASEPTRRKYSWSETLTIGRLGITMSTTASRPQEETQ